MLFFLDTYACSSAVSFKNEPQRSQIVYVMSQIFISMWVGFTVHEYIMTRNSAFHSDDLFKRVQDLIRKY